MRVDRPECRRVNVRQRLMHHFRSIPGAYQLIQSLTNPYPQFSRRRARKRYRNYLINRNPRLDECHQPRNQRSRLASARSSLYENVPMQLTADRDACCIVREVTQCHKPPNSPTSSGSTIATYSNGTDERLRSQTASRPESHAASNGQTLQFSQLSN